MKRLDRVEGARGIAALLIVLYHSSAIVGMPAHHGAPPLGGVLQGGWVGVDFFFVLSGFIIFHIHRGDLGRSGSWGRYLMKRVVRIYPPYWVVTLLVLPVYALVPAFGTGTELDPMRLLTSFALLPDAEAPVIAVAWSLKHEMLFYLVFGLVILHRRLGGAAFLAWQGAVVAACLFPVPSGAGPALLLDLRNLDFLLGAVAAQVVKRFQDRGRWGGAGEVPAVAAGVMLVVAMLGLSRVGLAFSWVTFGVGVGSVPIIVGLAGLDGRGPMRWGGTVRVLGEASYSIYLTHYVVVSAVGKALWVSGAGRAMGGTLMLVALVVAALGVGVGFRWFVEKPLLEFCSRWIPAGPKRRAEPVRG